MDFDVFYTTNGLKLSKKCIEVKKSYYEIKYHVTSSILYKTTLTKRAPYTQANFLI